MKKICEWHECRREFETTHGKKARFCSKTCYWAALRKLNQEKPKRYGHRPKSYREIVAANRKHPIAAGWRGQTVMGGW